MPKLTVTTCEVCERTAPEAKHPCRFERACACWYGKACAKPARVTGSEQRAMAEFIEDSRGDLIDMRYWCLDCADEDLYAVAYLWPAYDFSPDYDTHCEGCKALINVA
jgi:hypothetical protein